MYQTDDLNKYVLGDLQRELKLLRADFAELSRVTGPGPAPKPTRKPVKEELPEYPGVTPNAPPRTGDVESFQFGHFKTNAMLTIVRAARRGALAHGQARRDLHSLYLEINARLHAVLAVPSRAGWRQRFNTLDEGLFLYNLADAAPAPQAGFLLIHYFSARLAGRFELDTQLVVNPWRNFWPNGPETDFGALAGGLDTLRQTSATLAKQARLAALACDAKKLGQGRDELCALLVKLHDSYDEIVCRLERLRQSPRCEPTFIEQAHRWLGRAGYYVGAALRAWQNLALPEKDLPAQLPAQLVAQWTLLQHEQPRLEQAVAQYAAQQLCPPPQLCQPQLAEVRRLTQQGLAQARQLQNDPANCELRAQQAAHAAHTQDALDQFMRKGLPRKALNGCWWPLARIQWLLSCCQAEEEHCLLTDKQLEALLHKWQPQLANLGLSAAQCQGFARALRPATGPAVASCCEQHAAPTVNAPAYLKQFQEALAVGEGLRERLSGPRRAALDKALQEVKQKVAALEGGAHFPTRQLERALNQAKTALALAEQTAAQKAANGFGPRAPGNAPFVSLGQARFAKGGVQS